VTPTTKTVEVDIRSDDDDVHPQAVIREETAIEDANAKRLRFLGGLVGIVLASAVCGVALWRDNTLLVAGSFLGVMVAGNVIPYTVVRDIIVLRFRGGGS
jgi:hypothetical protein